MTVAEMGWLTVPLAMIGGAIRVSTPFLFVSLGECLTEKAGRVNIGLEGTLVFSAMSAYAISYVTGSPWIGVLGGGLPGTIFGAVHGVVCKLPRVNDIAIGIAMMLFGTGLAIFLGKPLIEPQAPRLPSLPLGFWSDVPQIQDALQVNPLFIAGAALAIAMTWAFKNTRWGLIVRITGIYPRRRSRWGIPRIGCACWLPQAAAFLRELAVHFFRSIILALGTKRFPPVKG